MGSFLSKCSPVDYTCYEIAHTWTPYCSAAPLDVAVPCISQSLRIYSTVYLAAAVFKGRITSAQQLRKLILGILRSSAFLTYNAFGFVWAHCLVRHLLGWANFWTLALVPGWLCSFLSIFVERSSRRTMLATYVTNVASESLYNSLRNNGIISPVKYVDCLLFSVALSGFCYIYKSEANSQDPMFGALRFMFGKDEEGKSTFEENSSATLSDADSGNSGLRPGLLSRPAACPHQGSCVLSTLKKTGKIFVAGCTFNIFLRIVSLLRKKNKGFGMGDFLRLPSCLASVVFIFQGVSCSQRWLTGRDTPTQSAIAGLLASPCFLLSRNTTLALYSFWKCVEVYIKWLHGKGILPTIPYFTELVYSLSTAVLFHLGMLEPHSLRPSYLHFLNTITGHKISEVNRALVDSEYGSQASKIIQFIPQYKASYIRAAMQDRLKNFGTFV